MDNQLTLDTAYKQLTPVQKVFVDGYVKQAEEIASNRGLKITDQNAQPLVDASGPFQVSIVRAAIAERLKDISELSEINVSRTLRELSNIAYGTIDNFIEVDSFGGLPQFNLGAATPEQRATIKSIKTKTNMRQGTEELDFQMYDKLKAIELMMKYLGLLNEEHWKNEASKAAKADKLSNEMSNAQLADAYSQMING